MKHKRRIGSITGILTVMLLGIAAPSPLCRPMGTAPLPAPAKAPGDVPAKHALLIAVNGYESDSLHPTTPLEKRWWALHTVPDVERIRSVLTERFGFRLEDVRTLQQPAETTRKAILDAFENLIAATNAGDIVYIHYSGHGTEEPDKNVPGSYYQALVPADAVARNAPERCIRIKEIKGFLERLKAKHPLSITVTLDTCFAGGFARGRLSVRGESHRTGNSKGSLNLLVNPSDNEPDRGYVLIAATRSDQYAQETEDDRGRQMGLFSYALTRALLEMRNRPTYRELFARIEALIAQKNALQEPQISGNVNRTVFGQEEIAVPISIGVETRGEELWLQAGFLHGMTPGTTIDLFASDRDVTAPKPSAEATVQRVEATTSLLQLNPGSQLSGVHSALRGVVKEWRLVTNPLRIDVSGARIHPQYPAIRNILLEMEKRGLIVVQNAPDLPWDIRLVSTKSGLRLLSAYGNSLLVQQDEQHYVDVLPDTALLPRRIRLMVEGEARRRLFTQLRNAGDSSNMQVEVRVLPGATGNAALPAGASQTLSIGETFRLALTNRGNFPVYATLLYLSGDGTIKPIWPLPNDQSENLLRPYEERRLLADDGTERVFKASEPPGTELLKVILTSQRIDFSPGFSGQDLERGADLPLVRLLWNAQNGQRGVIPVTGSSGWATYDLWFRIQPASKQSR